MKPSFFNLRITYQNTTIMEYHSNLNATTYEQVVGAVKLAIVNYNEVKTRISPDKYLNFVVKNHKDGFKVVIRWMIVERVEGSEYAENFFIYSPSKDVSHIDWNVAEILSGVAVSDIKYTYNED